MNLRMSEYNGRTVPGALLGGLVDAVVEQDSVSAVDVLAGDDLDEKLLVAVRPGAQLGDDARRQ